MPSRLDFDATAPVAGLKVGYIAQWMKESPATDVDRAAMETMKKLKMEMKEVTLPDWPYSSLMPILFAEGAASFEELALNNQLGTLKVQVKDAWPNLFRQARFLSAVDFVQADRLRRKVALEMARIFREVDVLIVPSLRDEQLTITNFTGHPSLTLRAGFVQVSEARSDWAPDPANPLPKFNPPRRVPHGITIVGRLFDDGVAGAGGDCAGEGVRSGRGEAGGVLADVEGAAPISCLVSKRKQRPKVEQRLGQEEFRQHVESPVLRAANHRRHELHRRGTRPIELVIIGDERNPPLKERQQRLLDACNREGQLLPGIFRRLPHSRNATPHGDRQYHEALGAESDRASPRLWLTQ